MKTNTTCLSLVLLAAGLNFALGASGTKTPADKPELLALLRAKYVDYDKLPCKTDDLRDLIAQSQGGLSVAAAPQASPAMFSTVLPGNVTYLRAASFNPSSSWQDLAAQANQGNSAGLIIDLRSNTAPDDFNGALRVANFISGGQPSLVVRDPKLSPRTPSAPAVSLRGHPTVIVLTNHETRGAAEALAASLKAHGALVMGEATEGKAAIFKEVKLASGGVLRYAAAHVYLADGTDLWDRPVVPDVATNASGADEANALALIDRQQVADVITEAGLRHRMSEAALVRGQDPEQDEFLASREKGGTVGSSALPVTRDVALVEAIDSLKAIRVLQGQELASSPSVAVR